MFFPPKFFYRTSCSSDFFFGRKKPFLTCKSWWYVYHSERGPTQSPARSLKPSYDFGPTVVDSNPKNARIPNENENHFWSRGEKKNGKKYFFYWILVVNNRDPYFMVVSSHISNSQGFFHRSFWLRTGWSQNIEKYKLPWKTDTRGPFNIYSPWKMGWRLYIFLFGWPGLFPGAMLNLGGVSTKLANFPHFTQDSPRWFQHVSVAFFSSFLASTAPPAAGAAATGLAAA